MRNAIIAILLIAACAGIYWKFRDRIHGKVEETIKEAESNLTSTPPAPPSKPAAQVAAVPAAATVPLIDAASLAQLAAGQPVGDGTKTDLVVEVMGGEKAGEGSLPKQIHLNNDVALDISTLPLGGAIAPKSRTGFLVHLAAGQSGSLVPGSVEPLPASLESSLRGQNWRVQAPLPNAAAPPTPARYIWATEFVELLEGGPLKAVITIEGTFESHQRGTGNAQVESVTIKEMKGARFFFPRGSISAKQAAEAAQLKREGFDVTLLIPVDANANPKFQVRPDVQWNMPLKDQFEHWEKQFAGKSFGGLLALVSWADTRRLGDEHDRAVAGARQVVSRGEFTQSGPPDVVVRVHLADELYEEWFYSGLYSPQQWNFNLLWRQHPLVGTLQCAPMPACVVFKSNAKGETDGDFYRIQ